jgi:hypothetical protein
MEYLEPAEPNDARTFLWQWEHPESAGPDLAALRHIVDATDRWGRAIMRGRIGVDIGARHVLVTADGVPKVIDLFGIAMQGLLDDLLDRPVEFVRRVPAHERRYILDQPDLHTDHPADLLARLRAAIASLPDD